MRSTFPRPLARATLCCLSFTLAACNRASQPAAGAQGGPPPSAVQIVTLALKPVEQSSEFIATLKSLRSTTVQPEVEGFVTRIFVKSGDRVRAGAPLVQIDPDKQQASVRSTEASRAGLEADVKYWRQQVSRLQSLTEAGAISRQELEQAQTSLKSAEAKLSALDAEVREGNVQLRYYRVIAPQAGVVGDITIRPGDRVTNSTAITTIDDNSALEAYVQVPLDRSPDLRRGLPMQLLDADGKVVAANPITFVAPRVDETTQTVLVKSLLREAPPQARMQQFSRARIVWRTAPGLTIPLTAVTRISGQYFCFVAVEDKQGLVAKQRPIQVGDLLGNDYIVRSGLNPGDKLIVSGIQKIGDGVPVRAE